MVSGSISNVQQTAYMAPAHVRGRRARGQGRVRELQVVRRLAVQQRRDQVPPVEGARVLAEGPERKGVGGEAAQWGRRLVVSANESTEKLMLEPCQML